MLLNLYNQNDCYLSILKHHTITYGLPNNQVYIHSICFADLTKWIMVESYIDNYSSSISQNEGHKKFGDVEEMGKALQSYPNWNLLL